MAEKILNYSSLKYKSLTLHSANVIIHLSVLYNCVQNVIQLSDEIILDHRIFLMTLNLRQPFSYNDLVLLQNFSIWVNVISSDSYNLIWSCMHFAFTHSFEVITLGHIQEYEMNDCMRS